ncbi:MAG TPA: asparagine synthetase B family protein [Vicinamibacterales bacterium]|nr:asparagine synthetase B family protein [Vicinamibacterales bacterium]
MPGLVGQVSTRDSDTASHRFGAAVDRMRRHPRLSVQSAAAGAWRLGHVHLDAGRPAPEIGAPGDRIHAVIHGALDNESALRAARGTPPTSSVNALIADLYQEHDLGFVSRLEGEFCLALIDEQRRRLLVATDTIGSHPIYWRADARGLVFASDLSAVLRAAPGATRLNLRAVADYLSIGAVLGDKTLADGVLLLPPGTLLVHGLDDGRTTLHQYVQLESFFRQEWTDRADYLEAVQAAFRQAVGRALSSSKPIGLSLSGGLDSRAILSAANGRTSTLRTFTLGVPGCADQVIAGQLARIAGTQHRFFELNRSYLRDFLPNMAEMVSLTDGMYLSHGLTEMLAVRFLEQTDIGVLLRGHGGELAKAHLAWPLNTDAHVYAMTSTEELIPYLLARDTLIYAADLPVTRLLTPEAYAKAGDGARETMASILADTRLSPAECCSYLYLRELTRRFTIPSLELFRTRVEVRLPYLDASFLKVLLAAPSKWRDSTDIHRALTRSGIPRLVKVRNSNTGAAADAGPLAEYVLDKLNTALKRMNVRGYRHYHNFDDWMRTGLLDSVEAELLAPSARVRTFVDKRTLQELIGQTRTGAADRSYLLQVLLILELWQRENGIEDAA